MNVNLRQSLFFCLWSSLSLVVKKKHSSSQLFFPSAKAGLQIATDMVANATNIFSLATKNFGLVTTLATRFLYDLDLKLKQTFHFILLCFCHKKWAKSHKQSQFRGRLRTAVPALGLYFNHRGTHWSFHSQTK